MRYKLLSLDSAEKIDAHANKLFGGKKKKKMKMGVAPELLTVSDDMLVTEPFQLGE